jgi:hypothetical protein
MRRRLLVTLALGLSAAAVQLPGPAVASWGQQAIIQDDPNLDANPLATLLQFRKLGARIVRAWLPWSFVAPKWQSRTKPAGFNAADPASYPDANWTTWDTIVRDAAKTGITVDFEVAGGSPLWADAPGAPHDVLVDQYFSWKPSAREYGLFVKALGIRYSGHYADPMNPGSTLPKVSFWTIWNEPNFGEDLAPQAINGSTLPVSPRYYRGLVDSAWSALNATGHGSDTILIGGTTARGLHFKPDKKHPDGFPGNFAQTKPLAFIRWLYCVDTSFRPLRGGFAGALGCPTDAAGSRAFRAAHPALFAATAWAQHPYPLDQQPNMERYRDPDYASFPRLPNLWHELDHLQRIYGSNTRYPIVIDEYGYITNPPNPATPVTPATAAYYINWAEYLFWRTARVKTAMQYLLQDPTSANAATFSSGLEFANDHHKPSYNAYRMPIYLPVTSTRRGRALEVWGAVRPAHYAQLDTGQRQSVDIEFQQGSRGAFRTLATIPLNGPGGYFDQQITFPASGSVRLAWTYPTADLNFPPEAPGVSVHSRTVQITVR